MGTFKCYYKTGGTTARKSCFATCESWDSAMIRCRDKIREIGHSSESDIMEEALSLRGYYCVGYSSSEIIVEEC